MGAKFVELIGSQPDSEKGMPPTTALLLGILKIKEIFKDAVYNEAAHDGGVLKFVMPT